MRQLSASVGLYGVNRKDDVRTVQELLNVVPHADGGPLVKLKEDGLCGYKTNGAIEKVQAKKWGWHRVTTKVEPGSATWLLLVSYDQPAPSPAVAAPPPPPPPEPPKQVSTSFAIMVAASPGQPLREPNFYFLFTDMTDQSQKALYYFGNITPPPLPQPLKWSVTKPMIVHPPQALGAADWSGEAMFSEGGDAQDWHTRIILVPDILKNRTVQIELYSHLSEPPTSPGGSRSSFAMDFKLVDASERVRGL